MDALSVLYFLGIRFTGHKMLKLNEVKLPSPLGEGLGMGAYNNKLQTPNKTTNHKQQTINELQSFIR